MSSLYDFDDETATPGSATTLSREDENKITFRNGGNVDPQHTIDADASSVDTESRKTRDMSNLRTNMKKNILGSFRSIKRESFRASPRAASSRQISVGGSASGCSSGLYDSSNDDSDDNDNYAELFNNDFAGETKAHDPAPQHSTASSIQSAPAISPEERARRDAKKKKITEKLVKYKKERVQLRASCQALEQQLVQTTEKLREVDLKAANKIDRLESELNETRGIMESMVNNTGKEKSDQTMCIKTLGKKLIKQAHVIKQQKRSVEQYQIQLEALQEEMAMQEERDSIMEDDFVSLRHDYKSIKKQKEAMQHTLQENIEEMMDLKQERDNAAERIAELESSLDQKETDLRRVTRESTEKSERITALENDLVAKAREVESVTDQMKASELSLQIMKAELERSTDEMEDLKNRVAELDSISNSRSSKQRPSFLGWRNQRITSEGDDDEGDCLEDQLVQRDMKIQALDQTVKTNEETIMSLKSDIVKMSSSFKQDEYLKRKQIGKLKLINAEYAKKLKSLESSFRAINEESMHGALSMHGSSVHSARAISKEDRADAVKARLGEVDASSGSEGSIDLRKGEMPVEC